MLTSANKQLEEEKMNSIDKQDVLIKEWNYYRSIYNETQDDYLKVQLNKEIISMGVDYFTISLILDFFKLNIELNETLTSNKFIKLLKTNQENYKRLLFCIISIFTLAYYLGDKKHAFWRHQYLTDKLVVYLNGLDAAVLFLQNKKELDATLKFLLKDVNIVRSWLNL